MREKLEKDKDDAERRAKELEERMNRYQEENEKYQRGIKTSFFSVF